MRRVKFGKFAGVKIKGKIPMEVDSDGDGVVTHAERAAWLTAKVESNGKYGCAMNYDGTGMTAGLHQAVAVYPRALSEKGSLWGLLEDVQSSVESQPLSEGALMFIALQELLVQDGYEFCVDGYLRNRETGRRASGREIRLILTGSSNGVMPESGVLRQDAESYIRTFHALFSCPETFQAQNKYGMKHFSRWSRRTMRYSRKYRDLTIDDFVYRNGLGARAGFLQVGNEIREDLDLAMCMFWSHTVNAPGMALKIFCKAADKCRQPIHLEDMSAFARELIRRLGESRYGRWDDDIKNGRYQRTRRYAKKFKGAWSGELFADVGIMPKDL